MDSDEEEMVTELEKEIENDKNDDDDSTDDEVRPYIIIKLIIFLQLTKYFTFLFLLY